MFERFSDDARQAVVEAQALARNEGSDAIRIEHLRIACEHIAAGIRTPLDAPAHGHIPFTNGTKHALEVALHVAQQDPDAVEDIELRHLAEAAAS